VNVTLSLPGASPDEISSSVIEPMEQAISGVSGIDEISARISEGRGNITVRFVLERDLNEAVQDVREKVSGAIKSVPPELLPPIITKVDPDADPVMSIMVASDGLSLRSLTEIADKQISRAIQTVNGVGQVTIAGSRAREIHIVVDVEKLNSYGLSIAQVRDAVVAENVEIPGGAVEQGKGQLLLRTLGRIDATQDFNNIVVATKGGTPIRVSDVGYAEDGSERPTSSVWLGDKPAVLLDIRRAMGENTVAVIEGVRAKLPSIRRSLPKAVAMTIIRDDSRFIYASVASLEEHLIFGSLFAAIVVMVFIRNIRAVIIAALAIPASIISSFTLMNIMGFTLNNMTLLGITLAVGIVIDDAIVVLENIFRYIEEKGVTPYEAAIQGTREVALAVMATTLSLVVIFLPIAFMTGYARRFINPFGLTMAFAILVSMLVSFTLTPMLSSRFLKLADAEADHKTKEQGFFHWLDTTYTRQVNWALDHPGIIIGVSIVTFFLTFPLNRMVGREFVPNEDMGEWTIHFDTPEGTSLAGTSEAGAQVLKELEGIEGIAQIVPSIGVIGGGSGASTHMHLLCLALPIGERKNTQAQMIAEMRKRLAAHPAYRATISARNALGSGEGNGGYPISANILGPDLDQLTTYSLRALAAAQKLPSLADTKIQLSVSNPEIHVLVDRKRAADLGVRMATVGNTLRLAVAGDDQISNFREGAGVPVKVRVLENQRRDIEQIGRLTVPSVTGPVRIDNIARLERGLGPSALQRSNRQYTVSLQADMAPGHALDEASNDIRKMFAGLNMPSDMTFRLQGQSKILDETAEPDHGGRAGDDLVTWCWPRSSRASCSRSSSCWRCRLPSRSRCSRSGRPAGR
jgi:HAE1 family hydrophobic/amphiphilic exporter-1